MLRISHSWRIAAVLIPLGALVGHAAEPTPEQVLEQHGLARSGTRYCIAEEAEVISEFHKVRPLIHYLAQAHGKCVEVEVNEYQLRYAEEYQNNLVAELSSVDATLPGMPQRSPAERLAYRQMTLYRNQVNQELITTRSQVNTLKGRQVPPRVKMDLQKEFKEHRGNFLAAASELRKPYDVCMAKYRELAENSLVKNALFTYGQINKVKVSVGPSREMEKAIGIVKQAERAYSPETVVPKAPPDKKKRRKG